MSFPPAQYAVSDSGTLAYIPGVVRLATRFLVWVGRDGSEEQLAAEPRGYSYPRISPDGQRAAVVGDNGILVWDFRLETLTRLTVDPLGDNYPVWTSDGERIAYRSDEDVYWKASNNTGSAELLVENPGEGDASPYFFSPDGNTLVFREQTLGQGRGALENLGMISLEDDAEPVWLLRSEFTERNAVLSPNGLYIAYQSNESGRFEVFVSPFPNFEDDRVQISNSGGEDPLWSPDGRELFYLEPGSPARLMVMSVETELDFTPGDRRLLLNWPYAVVGDGRNFDIAPDGDRFLAISLRPIEEYGADTTVPKINIVLNWFEELKARVPVP